MKDVIGYEDIFSVTEDGRVYSKRTNKFLVQGTLKTGYKVISSKIGGRNGTSVCLRVHRMVAEAFIANPENKEQVNHKDGDKSNNNVYNLEWVTASENIQHAWDTGLKDSYTISGEDNIMSKLTTEQVVRIREVYTPYSSKFGARALSRDFGVNKETILDIVHGRTWKK